MHDMGSLGRMLQIDLPGEAGLAAQLSVGTCSQQGAESTCPWVDAACRGETPLLSRRSRRLLRGSVVCVNRTGPLLSGRCKQQSTSSTWESGQSVT